MSQLPHPVEAVRQSPWIPTTSRADGEFGTMEDRMREEVRMMLPIRMELIVSV